MKYVCTTHTVNPKTTIVFCQGEMGIAAVEELHQAVDPPSSRTCRQTGGKDLPQASPEAGRPVLALLGGLAALIAASLAWSLYLYLTR